MHKNLRSIGYVVLALMLFHTAGAPLVSAAMIESETMVSIAQVDDARAKVSAMLARQDVQSALEQQGISAVEAISRLHALSNAEIMQLSDRIDQLPAGGEAIVGAIVFIFVILLATDLLGLTDVFPFVNK